jgi:hypothetical protein
MNQKSLYAASAGFVMLLSAASAQTPGAVQQSDTVQQQRGLMQSAKSYHDGDSAPELYPEENADVGPQTVLKMKPRRTLFEAMADAQYFYTDNMFLNERKSHEADVLVSTAQFALAPTAYDFAGGKLAPRIGYQHQWFDYGLVDKDKADVFHYHTGDTTSSHLNLFDFNSQTAFTDVQWFKGRWALEAGFDFRRLLSTANYEEFYKEYVPRWNAQYILPVCKSAAITLGYAGDYRFTDVKSTVFTPVSSSPIPITPDLGDRTDHMLFATYNQSLSRRAMLQPYYQLRYTYFTGPGPERSDLLSSVGMAVYWTVCANCELRTFVGYNLRFSDDSAASEYSEFDGGGGINLTFRF